ncbi:MAG: phytanoyl-CoA dioxygenase family protein [Acidimicrobiia bacterium]|nr:phytanoyl-CoA dioxygenase family protein [Acidimicrobiia bacterium]
MSAHPTGDLLPARDQADRVVGHTGRSVAVLVGLRTLGEAGDMAQLSHFSSDDDATAVIAALERDGGAIVAGMLPADAVTAIVEELGPALAATASGSRDPDPKWQVFHGAATKRFTGLAVRSRAFVDHALLQPLLLATADALLLPHGSDYWLNTGQVMAIGPGEPAQVLHRDEGNWPEARRPGVELTISAMFALSDFTIENGATIVYPGSHLVDAAASRSDDGVDLDDPAYAVMPAGSGLIYTGKVLHGAGHNASAEWRYGLHVSFVVGWLRPEEASPLMVERALAMELPTRARELLGWSSYYSRGGGRTWLVDFEDAALLFE